MKKLIIDPKTGQKLLNQIASQLAFEYRTGAYDRLTAKNGIYPNSVMAKKYFNIVLSESASVLIN